MLLTQVSCLGLMLSDCGILKGMGPGNSSERSEFFVAWKRAERQLQVDRIRKDSKVRLVFLCVLQYLPKERISWFLFVLKLRKVKLSQKIHLEREIEINKIEKNNVVCQESNQLHPPQRSTLPPSI